MRAAIPAGGSTYTPNLGVGTGASTPYSSGSAAAPNAVQIVGPSWVQAPNVTLSATGNWAVYVLTKTPTGAANYSTGTVLSIGTPSPAIFTGTSHLDITWCTQYFNPWNQGNYADSFVATGRDDYGTPISRRVPVNGETFFGVGGVNPLIGQGGYNDGLTHGLVIQNRNGTVEFWGVDPAGPRIMDSGWFNAGNFKGITNQPLRIGAAEMSPQLSSNSAAQTYYYEPVQGVIIYNEGCLTDVQMQRIYAGEDARNVLSFNAANGDRYYPGTIAGTSTSGSMVELVNNQAGVISGTVNQVSSILPTTLIDDVIVDMDGYGEVLPRDPPPAATTKVRFWGTRMGPTANIQMRVVQWNAPNPITSGTQVIVNWTTVATNVQNGQTWIGDLPGVPSPTPFADYDCDVSWTSTNGTWSAPKRLHRQWTLGVSAGVGGQSIVEKQRDDSSYPGLSFNSEVRGFLRCVYNLTQGSTNLEDPSQTQWWSTRWTPAAPTVNPSNYGEMLLTQQLSLLTDSPVGIGSFAVGGSPIEPYLGNTEDWNRWKIFIQRDRPQIGIWGNGQGDTGQSRSQRFACLDQLLAQYDQAVQTAPGGPWNYEFYVFPCNGDWGGDCDNVRSYDTQWAISRANQGKPVGVLCSVLDEATQDGTHMADDLAGLGLFASREAQTLANAVGLATYTGLGPQVDLQNSTWTNTGGVATANLVIIPNGGTAIETGTFGGIIGGSSASGFQISLDGGSIPTATGSNWATATILDPTHITVTATAAAQHSMLITYLGGGPGDIWNDQNTTPTQAGFVNAVYDNRGDMTGLVPGFPMAPITQTDPMTVVKLGSPAPPTNLTATGQGTDQVALSWTASTGTSYNVYRSTTGGRSTGFVASTAGTSYTDTPPISGFPYFYVVTCSNSAGQSYFSNEVEVTPGLFLAQDNFIDAQWNNRTGANQLNWWVMGSPNSILSTLFDDSNEIAGLGLEFTPTASGQGVVANLPSTFNLENGQAVSFTYTFRYTGTTSLNQAGLLRFGLYNNNGTPTISDDDDLTTQTRYDDYGYYCLTNPGLAANNGTIVGRETAGGEILDTTGLATIGISGSSARAGTTTHAATLTLTRSGSNLIVSASIDGHTAATGTDTAPLTFSFNEVAISNVWSSQPSPVIFSDVYIASSGSMGLAPTGLTTVATSNQVALSWSGVSGAATYNILRSITIGGPYAQIGVASTNSYTDTSANNGNVYYYEITAVDAVPGASSSPEMVTMPMTFEQWESKYNIGGGLAGTPQNDGVCNGLKFLCDIDPSRPATGSDWAALPAVGTAVGTGSNAGNQYLTLTYRQNPLTAGVTVNFQTCQDMVTWITVSPDIDQQIGTDPGTGDPIIQLGAIITGQSKEFLRLNVGAQ